MTITIIGMGLIGGSMALVLKDNGMADQIIGVENNPAHAAKAIELGLADKIESLDFAIEEADLIILAIPVNVAEKLLPTLLGKINKQVVMDVGSTKNTICTIIKNLSNKMQGYLFKLIIMDINMPIKNGIVAT